MNKLGIQCQERHEEVYRYNRELKPIVVKSINITDREHYTKLASENPGIELVYRHVPNGSWNNPEIDGHKWAEHLYGLVGHIPEITLVEGHNEWIHAPPHNTPEDFDKADRFMFSFISWVHELWDEEVHAVVLNASCGHFNEDIADFFPRTLARLQLCGKCLLALHEYDHPNADMLGDGGYNLCGKFLRNLAGLKAAGYDKVRIAITECGVDSGVGVPVGSGHVGFKYWGEQASERYLNDRNLGWYLPLLQEIEGIAWATLFGCGMHGDWETFDIKNTPVIDGIGKIYSELPNNNGGDKVEIKFFDRDGVQRDEAWMRAQGYSVMWRRHGAAPGQKVYRLVELREKTGYHSCISNVVDRDGNPMANVDVAFRWSGAPDPPDPPTEVYAHDWYRNFVHGPTNVNGDVGPGMGTGAYHGHGECGPHQVWVRDPNVPSDIVECLGMLAGTFHDHMDQKFMLTDEPIEPEPPTTDGELLDVVKEIRDIALRIEAKIDGVPPPPPVDEPFRGEYYNNIDLSGEPVLVRDDPEISFSWGEGKPAPEITSDYFSVRWTGKRTFEGRTYTFKVLVDDGVRLWLDGNLLIESWKDQPPTPYQATVALAAGQHDIKVEYYERAGGATCVVWWE